MIDESTKRSIGDFKIVERESRDRFVEVNSDHIRIRDGFEGLEESYGWSRSNVT